MIFRGTQSVRSARIVRETRYFTHVVFAYLVVRAVFVFVAFDYVASDVRVSVITGLTVAHRSMIDRRTHGVSSTNHFFAHVNALGLCTRASRKLKNFHQYVYGVFVSSNFITCPIVLVLQISALSQLSFPKHRNSWTQMLF